VLDIEYWNGEEYRVFINYLNRYSGVKERKSERGSWREEVGERKESSEFLRKGVKVGF